MHPSDVANIQHSNLDRVSAEALLEAAVAVVINVGSSVSGRYLNSGRESCWRRAFRSSRLDDLAREIGKVTTCGPPWRSRKVHNQSDLRQDGA